MAGACMMLLDQLQDIIYNSLHAIQVYSYLHGTWTISEWTYCEYRHVVCIHAHTVNRHILHVC